MLLVMRWAGFIGWRYLSLSTLTLQSTSTQFLDPNLLMHSWPELWIEKLIPTIVDVTYCWMGYQNYVFRYDAVFIQYSELWNPYELSQMVSCYKITPLGKTNDRIWLLWKSRQYYLSSLNYCWYNWRLGDICNKQNYITMLIFSWKGHWPLLEYWCTRTWKKDQVVWSMTSCTNWLPYALQQKGVVKVANFKGCWAVDCVWSKLCFFPHGSVKL